ncbi:GntR family transcriptional regulator [Burkholderia sp. WAC0059]|uniref:GntR family transcriptional regulator n=1 Tax=Burkholderia sp. WAC0059 TaxID=2066022 RepID=UPI000C7EE868|nr:GntR family transcriptional regulator [Burkholderia sp. WAC0059]PLZ01386.1 GntR family transcriptional regulator [Burkholderia sp. WAC0059]
MNARTRPTSAATPNEAPEPLPDLTPRPSLGDRVYETLLARLISVKIAPGSRIPVDALVRELNVSQTPIRAALIRLETEGLVVKTHNVGYSAAPMPTRSRFEQIYDMRRLLEPYLAARATQNLSDAARDELATLATSMARPTSDDEKLAYGKFALQDADFHLWIAQHSGNDLAAEALTRLHAHTHLFRLRFHSHVTTEAIKEHAEIVSAMLDGNHEAAYTAMEEHVMRSRARMAPFFEVLD